MPIRPASSVRIKAGPCALPLLCHNGVAQQFDAVRFALDQVFAMIAAPCHHTLFCIRKACVAVCMIG